MADFETMNECNSNESIFLKNAQEIKNLEKTNISVEPSKDSETINESNNPKTQKKIEITNSIDNKDLEVVSNPHGESMEENLPISSFEDSRNILKENIDSIQCNVPPQHFEEESSEEKIQALKINNSFEVATDSTLLQVDEVIDSAGVSCTYNNTSRNLGEENSAKVDQQVIDIESKVVKDNVKEVVNMTDLETTVQCDNSNSDLSVRAEEVKHFEEKKLESVTEILQDNDVVNIPNKSDAIQTTADLSKRDLKVSNAVEIVPGAVEKSKQDSSQNIDASLKTSSSKDKDSKESNILKINPYDDRSVWISNINPSTTAKNLKLDLSKFGKVITAKIVSNGDKYYGYALMENSKFVDICIEKLNGTILNGYELEVGKETPNKKKGNVKDKKCPVGDEKKDVNKAEKDNIKEVTNKVEKSVRVRESIKKKRSFCEDPLTLKVTVKGNVEDGRRSRGYRNVEIKPIKRTGTCHKKRLSVEQESQLKKQRKLEMEIAMEKKKLAKNREQFEREKLEFLRLQRRFQEEKAKEEREKASKAREEQKDSLNARRRRSKTPKLYRREHKSDKSVKHYEERSSKENPPLLKRPLLESPKKGNPIPVLHRGYRDDKRYVEVKLQSDYPKYGRVDPPPPPRLTTDDLNACKSKSYESKKIIKRDFSPLFDLDRGGYFKKEEERKHRKLLEFDRRIFENESRRYSSEDSRKYSSLDRKHSENERRYSDEYYYKDYDKHNYKRIYDESKMLPLRSEISIPSSRNNFQYSGNNESRNVSYPVQYRSYPPPPVEYHVPLQDINDPNLHNNWTDHLKRPLYQKDQQSTHVRPFHQEDKYDGYDKKHQYFDFNRKY